METKINSQSARSGGHPEEPRLQEHLQLQVEDHSMEAEKILSEQKKQEGIAILFVP